jgi:hypothetical protein
MTNLELLLEHAVDIEGAFAASISDHRTGKCIGAQTSRVGFNSRAAGSFDSDVVRAQLAALAALGLESEIEDMLFSLDEQYHLIRPLAGTTLFLTLVLQRDRTNLALARRELQRLEAKILDDSRQFETTAPTTVRLGPRKLTEEELRRAS